MKPRIVRILYDLPRPTRRGVLRGLGASGIALVMARALPGCGTGADPVDEAAPPRVLLDLSVDGVEMGGEVHGDGAAPREIRVDVVASVRVVRVEIVRGDPTVPAFVFEPDTGTWAPDPVAWTDTEILDAETFYYARVYLEGQEMAWSSPVWFVPAP